MSDILPQKPRFLQHLTFCEAKHIEERRAGINQPEESQIAATTLSR